MLSVSNHAHPGIEGVAAVVNGFKRFASHCWTDRDPLAANAGEVEGMQWLSALQHHVVGDVDNVVDARDAHGGQTIDEPGRALAHTHSANHACRIERAHRRVGDLHRDALSSLATTFEWPGTRDQERPLEQHRQFTSHAQVTKAVGAVAGDLDFDRGVVAYGSSGLVIEARERKPLYQLLNGSGHTHILGQPVGGDDHPNCSRKRTSLR